MKKHKLGGLIKFITSRAFLAGIGIILQFLLVFLVLSRASEFWPVFRLFNIVISIISVLIIINNRSNAAYKVAWITMLLIAPIFGVFFYYLFAGQRVSKKEKRRMYTISKSLTENVKQDRQIIHKLREENLNAYRQAKYINDISQDPVFQNTKVTYFESGEDFIETYLEELKKAKKYIFLEYFIIAKGRMWDSILEVLEEKVKEGVDVRLIYDDFGCISSLPRYYNRQMEEKGIKCIAFNRVIPFLSIRMNNRDHRKLTVIDGKVGFTGGLNLADDYINVKQRFGYWKDTVIKLEGDAVWNITALFLSIWDYLCKNENEDYRKYKAKNNIVNDSYVAVYGTIPIINETIGENILLNMINRATNYIYITTPYLIIDNEIMTALCNAAKMGIDVRIVMPSIPDKKVVFIVSRSYYPLLIEAGVKIYEYTPGFIHSKLIVVDDEFVNVGTINFDYRSLYLNYECGAWIYKDKEILKIRKNVLDVISACREINADESQKIKRKHRFIKAILRFFAPLL